MQASHILFQPLLEVNLHSRYIRHGRQGMTWMVRESRSVFSSLDCHLSLLTWSFCCAEKSTLKLRGWFPLAPTGRDLLINWFPNGTSKTFGWDLHYKALQILHSPARGFQCLAFPGLAGYIFFLLQNPVLLWWQRPGNASRSAGTSVWSQALKLIPRHDTSVSSSFILLKSVSEPWRVGFSESIFQPCVFFP